MQLSLQPEDPAESQGPSAKLQPHPGPQVNVSPSPGLFTNLLDLGHIPDEGLIVDQRQQLPKLAEVCHKAFPDSLWEERLSAHCS